MYSHPRVGLVAPLLSKLVIMFIGNAVFFPSKAECEQQGNPLELQFGSNGTSAFWGDGRTLSVGAKTVARSRAGEAALR